MSSTVKMHTQKSTYSKRVGVFITCLVNTMRPSVGFATLTLLEQAGCDAEVPEAQGCCGQPAYNSGDDKGTRGIAKELIKQFEHYDYIVVPSGSCAGMLKKSFLEIFNDDKAWLKRAQRLSEKTYELLSFLTDVCDFKPQGIELNGTYTYHDSCSGLRSMNVYQQPRTLLANVSGLTHKPLKGNDECCGFGGTFCVKYSDISNEIVSEKIENIVDTNADYLLGGDVGCLMNMAGKLNRNQHTSISALHTAEVLAGMTLELLRKQNNARQT